MKLKWVILIGIILMSLILPNASALDVNLDSQSKTVVLGGDDIYCSIYGCVMQGNIDMNNYSIVNAYFVNATIINATEYRVDTISALGNITSSGLICDSIGCIMIDTRMKGDGDYLYNDSDTMYFNSTKLATRYYNATSVDLVRGTVDGGTLPDTYHYDGVSYDIAEETGANGLDIQFTFNAVEFNGIIIRMKMDGRDHPVNIQLYDYENLEWENYATIIEVEDYQVIELGVFDHLNHIDTGDNNKILLRLHMSSAGNTNHIYFFDWIQVIQGPATFSTQEIDPLSYHKNDNIDTNGYNITTNNINASLINVTDAYIENLYGGSPINILNNINATRFNLTLDQINATSYTGNGSQLTGIGFPEPTYDSDWTTMSQGEVKFFTHDIGGNESDYVVIVDARSPAFAVNMINFGTRQLSGGVAGYRWENLTSSLIRVWRLPQDISAEQLRVRIWRIN